MQTFSVNPETVSAHPLASDPLKELENGFNQFTTAMSAAGDTPYSKQLGMEIYGGRFTRDMLGKVGISNGQVRLVNGDWMPQGNLEGSDYIVIEKEDGPEVVRVRMDAAELYLGDTTDTTRNAFQLEGVIGDVKCIPKELDHRRVTGVTEEGIVTASLMDIIEYNRAVNKLADVPKSLLGRYRHGDTYIQERDELELPSTVTVPFEDFSEIATRTREGLLAGAQLLKDRLVELAA